SRPGHGEDPNRPSPYNRRSDDRSRPGAARGAARPAEAHRRRGRAHVKRAVRRARPHREHLAARARRGRADLARRGARRRAAAGRAAAELAARGNSRARPRRLGRGLPRTEPRRRMSDLLDLTAAVTAERVRFGELSADEVFEFYRERAADDQLGSYLWVADSK